MKISYSKTGEEVPKSPLALRFGDLAAVLLVRPGLESDLKVVELALLLDQPSSALLPGEAFDYRLTGMIDGLIDFDRRPLALLHFFLHAGCVVRVEEGRITDAEPGLKCLVGMSATVIMRETGADQLIMVWTGEPQVLDPEDGFRYTRVMTGLQRAFCL